MHYTLEWWKNKIFKQGIGIADKKPSNKKGSVGWQCKLQIPILTPIKMFTDHWVKIGICGLHYHPQRSLLVSWLFSAIPIPCLKILFFHSWNRCNCYFHKLIIVISIVAASCCNAVFFASNYPITMHMVDIHIERNCKWQTILLQRIISAMNLIPWIYTHTIRTCRLVWPYI